MRVKKLDIFGFKSFALKQAITFGEGVTGIVGPNGCGKSNVVDALRWVMGEQNARHLRGGNMQDIIFCGSEKKAPLGFAEVTLTMDNSTQDAPLEYNHFNEIEITRRLYKTGESEYEINRQKARLKDISDFFLGTGVGTKAYSIIEQGRVNEIISAKPVDRRLIIEEAAGITKYKARKVLAERRMESTRTNLSRIVDIKNEIDRRVAALHKEKEKLEKVEALKTRIRDIDLHIATHHLLSHHATLTYLKTQQSKTNDDIAAAKKDFAVLEHGFAKILADYSSVHDERRLLEALETEHKTSLELTKKDLDYAKTTLADNVNFLTRITAQLADLEHRRDELMADIDTFQTEMSGCQDHDDKLTKDIALLKATGDIVLTRRQKNLLDERDKERRIVEAASRAARLQSEITVAREQEAAQKQEAMNIAYELVQKQSELTQGETRRVALQSELNQGNDVKAELTQKLEQTGEEHRATTLNLVAARKNLSILDEERLIHVSRLKSLKEIADKCEWSESAVSDILASEHKALVKGIVADIIQVKPGHEDAVERYLAHLLDAAIVVNNRDLEELAQFIKEQKLPETAFLLLANKIPQRVAKPLGLKCLADVVKVNDAYAPLVHQFENFFLADTLATALNHWPAAQLAQATIISEHGELLLPDGRVIVLGNDNGKGVLKRKNEMVELDGKVSLLDDKKRELEEAVTALEQREKQLAEKETSLAQEQKNLMLGLVRLEETVKQKQEEHARLTADLTRLEDKRDELLDKNDLFDEKVAELSKQWSQALDEHKDFEESLEQLRDEKTSVDADYDAFQEKMRELEILKIGAREKTTRLNHSLTEAHKNLAHVATQKEAFSGQANEKMNEELVLKETIRQSEKRLADLSTEIDSTQKMLLDKRARCGELARAKESEEAKLHSLKAREQELRTRLHQHEIELNNIDNQLKNTEERIREKYRLNLREHVTDFHHTPLNEHKATQEKNDLVKTRDRLGAVNENAAREYDEFKQRSEFLHVQVEDLNAALMQLEDAIKKINKTTKLRFMEAFQSINTQFSKVFPRLFNGGKAELVLCDEEDLLSCGVDIIAKPPGKNIGSIELMSGGEKALTAISLIMAIFLIKPSPFCLLDEVDAPLDEANVARFSQLIKEMSALSQFIVITHNRKTMESADQLYGVTMEDAGLSKIVSVHVQQAFETLKMPMPTGTAPTAAAAAPAPKRPTQLFLDDA